MTLDIIGDVVGLLGMFLIVLAYFLTQTEKIKPTELIFTHINFAGASCLLFSLTIHFNLASFILEIVWISISLYGYYKYFKNRNKE